MKYVGLIALLFAANSWSVNPAVLKLRHGEEGKVGAIEYKHYQVYCGNGMKADMVRWGDESQTTMTYCVGTHDASVGPCGSGRTAKLTIASEACGTTKRSRQAPKNDFACGAKRYCGEMDSCAEAKFYHSQCGLDRLDGDKDGVPCESLCR